MATAGLEILTPEKAAELKTYALTINGANGRMYDQEPIEPPHDSDTGNGRRLIQRHGHDLRYCPQLGWLVWDARRWRIDESGELERRAKETVRHMYVEAAECPDKDRRESLVSWALKSESAQKIAAMITSAKSEPGVYIAQNELDADLWLLNLANGTLNLATGQLREHRRGDLITNLSNIEYQVEATCPRWERFLARITDSNAALLSFIQRAVGYSLTGSTEEQVIFMPYGTGANGKTTFLSGVEAICADYAKTTRADTFLVKRGDQSNDIARLAGARFVAASETESGRRLAEGLVKTLTGGDKITARFLYHEPFEFVPQFKLWLSTNHKPRIRGTEHSRRDSRTDVTKAGGFGPELHLEHDTTRSMTQKRSCSMFFFIYAYARGLYVNQCHGLSCVMVG